MASLRLSSSRLASVGLSWPLLAALGLVRPLLASPGLSRPLLAALGRSSPLLASPGLSWPLLAATRLSWPLLASPGRSCPPLASPGLPWPLLASLGRSWLNLFSFKKIKNLNYAKFKGLSSQPSHLDMVLSFTKKCHRAEAQTTFHNGLPIPFFGETISCVFNKCVSRLVSGLSWPLAASLKMRFTTSIWSLLASRGLSLKNVFHD